MSQLPPLRVVGAAVVDGAGRVLAAQRAGPPALAGCWEFPGGKVEPGEDERLALVRECREELGVEVLVGDLLGAVPLTASAGCGVLRVYVCALAAGEPQPWPREHHALRWLPPDELDDVPWIDADRPLVAALARRLRTGEGAPDPEHRRT